MFQVKISLKRAFGFIARVMVTALLITAILCGGLAAGNMLLGFKSYSIISGSMAPLLHEGDLVFVKQIPFEELCVDDVITFRQPDSNAIVTHRISRIDPETNQVYTIGDRNRYEDPSPVDAENIKGVYVYKISGMGAWFK